MNRRVGCVPLVVLTFVTGALGSPSKRHRDSRADNSKVIRHDPAFGTGYMDGYRQGAKDSAALSNSYRDESGPVYDDALDGYTPQYGDLRDHRCPPHSAVKAVDSLRSVAPSATAARTNTSLLTRQRPNTNAISATE